MMMKPTKSEFSPASPAAHPVRPASIAAVTWEVMTLGQRRLVASAAAVARIKDAATPPASCGPEIPVAPARGAFRTFQPVEMVAGSEARVRSAGYRGPGEDRPRDAVALVDVFDRMARDAAKRGDDAPFTHGQVAMARIYRDLIERHDAGGVRCSSLETGRGGSGSGGEFIDAFVAEGRTIDHLLRRIGTGAAMEVRRVRPSKRGGSARGIITDRMLVDAVCLGGKSLTSVLREHGWSVYKQHLTALRVALAAALDRMQGYDLRRPTR